MGCYCFNSVGDRTRHEYSRLSYSNMTAALAYDKVCCSSSSILWPPPTYRFLSASIGMGREVQWSFRITKNPPHILCGSSAPKCKFSSASVLIGKVGKLWLCKYLQYWLVFEMYISQLTLYSCYTIALHCYIRLYKIDTLVVRLSSTM